MGDPMGVSVRHNSKLAAAVALAAAVLAVVWFARALQTGSFVDWAWCLVVTAVGVLQLLVVRDSRAPLMVADEHGVRVRRGVTWSGLRWQDIENVEVTSPRPWLRDGRIVVQPRAVEGPLEEPTDEGEAPAPSLTTVNFVVPLGLTTRLEFEGLTGDLVADLDALASGRVPVLVLTRIGESREAGEARRSPRRPRSPSGSPAGSGAELQGVARRPSAQRARRARGAARSREDAHQGGSRARLHPQAAPDEEPEFDPVEPARETRPAARNEVIKDSVPDAAGPAADPGPACRRRPGRGGPGRRLRARPSRVRPTTPSIGPLIAAARHRARLSIDTLSERTRIRPHVLECIEVDDFAACGGDFYARGHLRTLARIFGLDAQQLLDLYDDHYAHRRDRGTPGLRGRAGHRHRRRRPRHPHRPALEPARRLRARAGGRVGRGPGLQRHPAGAGQPGSGRGRLRGPGQRRRADSSPKMTLAPPRGERVRGEPAGRRTRPRRPDPVGRQARGRPAPAGHRAGAVRRHREQRQRGQGVLPGQAEGHRGRLLCARPARRSARPRASSAVFVMLGAVGHTRHGS